MDNILLGSWRLISSVLKTDDNKIRFPLGNSMIGLLYYDSSGYMAVQLYSTGQAPFVQSDQFKGSDQEIRQAFVTSLCYVGRYKIDCSQK